MRFDSSLAAAQRRTRAGGWRAGVSALSSHRKRMNAGAVSVTTSTGDGAQRYRTFRGAGWPERPRCRPMRSSRARGFLMAMSGYVVASCCASVIETHVCEMPSRARCAPENHQALEATTSGTGYCPGGPSTCMHAPGPYEASAHDSHRGRQPTCLQTPSADRRSGQIVGCARRPLPRSCRTVVQGKPTRAHAAHGTAASPTPPSSLAIPATPCPTRSALPSSRPGAPWRRQPCAARPWPHR